MVRQDRQRPEGLVPGVLRPTTARVRRTDRCRPWSSMGGRDHCDSASLSVLCVDCHYFVRYALSRQARNTMYAPVYVLFDYFVQCKRPQYFIGALQCKALALSRLTGCWFRKRANSAGSLPLLRPRALARYAYNSALNQRSSMACNAS